MKIGIFADVHANLPAMAKALEYFEREGCQFIYHVGDLIGIGPYPSECIELALSTPNFIPVMGNHDYWYAFGLPDPVPSWMSKEEIEHQRWTHRQIGAEHIPVVRQWPFSIRAEFNDLSVVFRHYGLNANGNWFRDFLKRHEPVDLDNLFDDVHADLIFHGHDHQLRDISGRSRYVNTGSAGCYDRAEVRIGILSSEKDKPYVLEKHALHYKDDNLMAAYDEREVPARDFIRSTFITRR